MVDITFYKNRGDIEQNCVLIESDVFNISQRIKEIDEGYFIVFNPTNQRYELHHSEQADSSYCSTLPYEELDGRAIERTREMSAARARIILAEMKAHNEKLEHDNNKKIENEVAWKAKEIYQHSLRHGVDGMFDDGAFKTSWS